MNSCDRVLEGFCANFRELEANIADLRTELNKTQCRCSIRQGDTNKEHSSYTLNISFISEIGRSTTPFEFATVAPVVPQSSEQTPCAWSNFFAQNAAEEILFSMQKNPQEDGSNLGRFIGLNLEFDPKGNVHIFLCLFEMSMYGASNRNKATALLN